MSLVRKSMSAMFVLSSLQRHCQRLCRLFAKARQPRSIVCSTLLSVPLHRLRPFLQRHCQRLCRLFAKARQPRSIVPLFAVACVCPIAQAASDDESTQRLLDAVGTQTAAAAASSDTVRPTKASSVCFFFGPQAQPNDLEHLCAFYKVLAATYALLVFAIQHTVVDVPSCFAYSRRVQARQAQSIATLRIAVDVHWRLATMKATQSL